MTGEKGAVCEFDCALDVDDQIGDWQPCASPQLRFGYEMSDLFEHGELTEDADLTGRFELPEHKVDPDILLLEMQQFEEDEALAEADFDLDFDE